MLKCFKNLENTFILIEELMIEIPLLEYKGERLISNFQFQRLI